MQVNLLDFFRTASFGGVRTGFHRDEVEATLGKPDVFNPGHSSSENYKDAALWYYAGVQFTFLDLKSEILSDIGFVPFYLSPERFYRDLQTEKTELDIWVFSSTREPSVHDLKLALEKENIPFKDTGLETILYNRDRKTFELIPYNPALKDVESFGTLVLQSGVQIRYSDDTSIVRVTSSRDSWAVKGREQDIHFSTLLL